MDDIEIAFIGGSGLYKIPGFKNFKWQKVKSEQHFKDNKHPFDFTFEFYQKNL